MSATLAAVRFMLLGVFVLSVTSCAAPGRNAEAGPRDASVHFANPPGSMKRTSIVTRLPTLIGRFIQHGLVSQTRDHGHILLPADVERRYASLEGKDSITWIGHMTVLLRLDGRNILTDPWWANYASPVPGLGPKRYAPPAIALEDLPPIDIVVVSHSHRDHLDLDAIARLPRGVAITAVVPIGIGHFFRERGYARVIELDWEQSVTVTGVTLTSLPAIHWSKRTMFRTNDTLWSAFAIEGPSGTRIYFGGDSDYGPVHTRLASRFGGFDLALLSIGGFHNDGVHCAPEQCVQIGAELGADVLVPLHWGTIYLGEGPPHELPARFVSAAVANGYAASSVWVMPIGDTRALPPPANPRGPRPMLVTARVAPEAGDSD